MFIKTESYTVNTDQIVWAQMHENDTCSVYLVGGKSIILMPNEVKEFWAMIGRQTLPSLFAQESEDSK